MRFLIDANLPRTVIAVVRSLGHHAEFARDIGLGAATDDQIAKHALHYRAALLTRDLDFADIRRYPPHQYSGIVVLRLPDTAVAEEIAAVKGIPAENVNGQFPRLPPLPAGQPAFKTPSRVSWIGSYDPQ